MYASGGGAFPILILLIFFLLAAIFGGKKGGYKLRYRISDSLRYKIKWPCINCNKWAWFKKKWRVLTLVMVLATSCTWIIFLWFYPKRCEVCNLRMSKSPANSARYISLKE